MKQIQNNYLEIEKTFLDKIFRRTQFAYIDLPEYYADEIMHSNHIKTIKFKKQFSHPACEYIIIIASIKDREREAFIDAMEQLPKKMAILGHNDYLEISEAIKNCLEEEDLFYDE